MLPVFMILRRLVQALVAAWKSDPEFRVLVFLVVSILLSGTGFYTFAEKWSVVDAFYFSVTTLTTVGFGDPAPETTLGKLFTVVYIFVGLGIIGGFINVLAKHTFALRRRHGSEGEGQEGAPPSQGSQDG
jgi:voltage-gated potassium channel